MASIITPFMMRILIAVILIDDPHSKHDRVVQKSRSREAETADQTNRALERERESSIEMAGQNSPGVHRRDPMADRREGKPRVCANGPARSHPWHMVNVM